MLEEKKIPITTMEKIFRTSTDILLFANDVRESKRNITDIEGYEFVFQSKLDDIFDKFLKDHINYQIICPYNVYPNGANAINKKAQKKLISEGLLEKSIFTTVK
jgi:hypothetical protein